MWDFVPFVLLCRATLEHVTCIFTLICFAQLNFTRYQSSTLKQAIELCECFSGLDMYQ